MTCGLEFAPTLRSRGFRVTAQRMAVLHALRHSPTSLTPAQVWQRARENLPDITETTVYRTLDFLSENGLVWRTHRNKGHLIYEMASTRHHHLICRQCGREMQIQHSLVKKMYSKLEAATGYLITDDHIALFGLCPECQKGNPADGDS